MKKTFRILAGVMIASNLFGCGFDLNTSGNLELPNTYGVNVETILTTPSFILSHDVTFSDISVNYTVHKNDAFAANVKIYISADQTTDVVEQPSDEDIINVSLGITESSKSGNVSSQLLKDILNAKQSSFVIGAQNLSVSPISSVFIDLDVKLKGTVK